jgi:hypothetical protein
LWRFARGRGLGAVRGARVRPDDQIAEAAEISRRTFFRYLAEDERLLGVLHDTLDAAPPGEPVLDLALQARRMAKTLRWEQAIAARLAERGSTELEALPAPKLALAGLAG